MRQQLGFPALPSPSSSSSCVHSLARYVGFSSVMKGPKLLQDNHSTRSEAMGFNPSLWPSAGACGFQLILAFPQFISIFPFPTPTACCVGFKLQHQKQRHPYRDCLTSFHNCVRSDPSNKSLLCVVVLLLIEPYMIQNLKSEVSSSNMQVPMN